MSWEEAMWAELDAQPKERQIILAEEFISTMSHRLLGELAQHRRLVVVELIESSRYTYATLADTIGSRPGTMRRLAEDGRAIRRQLNAQDQAEYEEAQAA
jgi:hypothetical protein